MNKYVEQFENIFALAYCRQAESKKIPKFILQFIATTAANPTNLIVSLRLLDHASSW